MPGPLAGRHVALASHFAPLVAVRNQFLLLLVLAVRARLPGRRGAVVVVWKGGSPLSRAEQTEHHDPPDRHLPTNTLLLLLLLRLREGQRVWTPPSCPSSTTSAWCWPRSGPPPPSASAAPSSTSSPSSTSTWWVLADTTISCPPHVLLIKTLEICLLFLAKERTAPEITH